MRVVVYQKAYLIVVSEKRVCLMNRYITVALIISILSLCGWIWVQSQEISSLKAKNQAQAQIITEQETVNKTLQTNLAIERSAVEKQTALTNQYKSQAETKQEKVRYVLKNNQCANTVMPDDVIKQLRQ